MGVFGSFWLCAGVFWDSCGSRCNVTVRHELWFEMMWAVTTIENLCSFCKTSTRGVARVQLPSCLNIRQMRSIVFQLGGRCGVDGARRQLKGGRVFILRGQQASPRRSSAQSKGVLLEGCPSRRVQLVLILYWVLNKYQWYCT